MDKSLECKSGYAHNPIRADRGVVSFRDGEPVEPTEYGYVNSEPGDTATCEQCSQVVTHGKTYSGTASLSDTGMTLEVGPSLTPVDPLTALANTIGLDVPFHVYSATPGEEYGAAIVLRGRWDKNTRTVEIGLGIRRGTGWYVAS